MLVRTGGLRLLAKFLTLALCLWAGGSVVAEPTGRVAGEFEKLAAPGMHQTRVRLLTDNVESWFARWLVIENATKSLDITYFIVEPDIFGKSMLGLLHKKIKEGVKVRIMIDARGTAGLAKRFSGQGYLQDLHEAGADIRVFNPWHKHLFKLPKDVRELIASNHDKIILADSEWAVTGGRNISDRYFADPADMPECYRDTDVLIKGSTIGKEMTLAFTEEFERLSNYSIAKKWLFDGNEGFELDVAYHVMRRWILGMGVHSAEDFPKSKLLGKLSEEVAKNSKMQWYDAFQRDVWQGRREYPVKVLDKHSFADPRNDITANMLALFDAAEKSIHIQNPYVIMTKEVFESLKRASDRGVSITLHTNSPASTDSLITQAFFLRDWKKLLRDIPKLRVFAFHGDRKLHAKVFVVDDQVASIGTYNLDPMSQGINSEVMAVVHSPEFALGCRLKIDADVKDSVEFQIKVREDGVIERIHGPEDHLEGFSGTVIKLLSKLAFLRPLV